VGTYQWWRYYRLVCWEIMHIFSLDWPTTSHHIPCTLVIDGLILRGLPNRIHCHIDHRTNIPNRNDSIHKLSSNIFFRRKWIKFFNCTTDYILPRAAYLILAYIKSDSDTTIVHRFHQASVSDNINMYTLSFASTSRSSAFTHPWRQPLQCNPSPPTWSSYKHCRRRGRTICR